jgi:hypothetical protein
MKNLFAILLFTLFILQGCVNKRGIDTEFYNECKEYYDSRGFYHQECDKNVIEFEDVKQRVKKGVDAVTNEVKKLY